VKVRNALVDIKVLKQVNAQGLEQWIPIMKAAFPLAAAETAQLFDTLGLAGPSRSGAHCTLDAFIQQFARQGGAIRAVRVHK
jgi:exopolyphosphatase / guanosine-5'-triphosphate,3'-diphosphate pyrophosphatase